MAWVRTQSRIIVPSILLLRYYCFGFCQGVSYGFGTLIMKLDEAIGEFELLYSIELLEEQWRQFEFVDSTLDDGKDPVGRRTRPQP
jgi:hypothetical protein